MKNVIKVLAFFSFVTTLGSINAAGVTLTAEEFEQLLSGNTMNGVWGETNYQQYFNPNGRTIYQEENKQPTYGTWRINKQGRYCSIWPPSNAEACYDVTKDGETLLWRDGRGNIYPATVEPGKAF